MLGCSTLPAQATKNQTNLAIETNSSIAQTATPTAVYLPVVTNGREQKFFGIYLKKYWNNQNANEFMPIADQAAGKKHSSVGWFIDLEDDAFTIPVTDMSHNNLHRQLEELWNLGYLSFVNLASTGTADDIVNGDKDALIRNAAKFYKAWLDLGDGRIAMIAPFQEMNGAWTTYGLDASKDSVEKVKQAYLRLVNIFYEEGVARDQVMWVFAPNAWNPDNEPLRMFENYYPGDDVVDFVGFSSFNYGFCPSTVGVSAKWESYNELFAPYIPRMKALAPTKPLIIAETATTSYSNYDVSNVGTKDQWLIENYEFLAANPDVDGVYYFSMTEFNDRNCDFEVALRDNFAEGYQMGLTNQVYQYLSAEEIWNMTR